MNSILSYVWNKRFWWTGVSVLIIAAYAIALQGLRTDAEPWRAFPWQLCAALSTFAGLALAAGGFGITAMLSIIPLQHATELRRTSLMLTACAYVVAVLGTATNIVVSRFSGDHFAWFTSPVLLQTLLLLCLIVLAFAAEISDELATQMSERVLRTMAFLLSITGVISALMYNAEMERLFRQASSLWPTEHSSVTVFLSGMCGALAIIILSCWYRSQWLPLARLARIMAIIAVFVLVFRAMDLGERGLLGELWGFTVPATFLGLEVALLLGPILLLGRGHGDSDPSIVFACAASVLLSLVLNRMNTFLGSTHTFSAAFFRLNAMEILVSYFIVGIGILLFRYLTRSFDIRFIDPGEAT